MGKLGLSVMLGSGVKRAFVVIFAIALIAILPFAPSNTRDP